MAITICQAVTNRASFMACDQPKSAASAVNAAGASATDVHVTQTCGAPRSHAVWAIRAKASTMSPKPIVRIQHCRRIWRFRR